MPLIIDGYNLLYAAGLVNTDGSREGSFEAERVALLDALVSVVDPDELRRTTVVFDSAQAPPGLPRTYNYREITVRFATGYDDADALIEEMIAQHHSPRRLTVVSSDHRVQRAAKRRRAKAIDSGSWFRLMHRTRRRRTKDQANRPPVTKQPAAAVPSSEVKSWLEFFGEVDLADLQPPAESPRRSSTAPAKPNDPQVPHSQDDSMPEPAPDEPAGPIFSDDYLKQIAEEFFGGENKGSD